MNPNLAVIVLGNPLCPWIFLTTLLGALEQFSLRKFKHGVSHATNEEESKIFLE